MLEVVVTSVKAPGRHQVSRLKVGVDLAVTLPLLQQQTQTLEESK
jgi:hypothetical protein